MMSRVSRWLIYAAVSTVLPAVWIFTQLGGSGPLGNERPRTHAVGVERQVRSDALWAVVSGAGEGDDIAAVEPRPARKAPAIEQTIVGDLTAADFQELKEGYNCDLALAARRDCENAYEDADAYEMCLSLRQYYSYSRHCGYQP